MELIGMESVKCVIKNGKWGQWLKGFNLSASPDPQLEKGQSISPTGKGPCKKQGFGLRTKSGPKICPVRAHLLAPHHRAIECEIRMQRPLFVKVNLSS